jgi:hypothetical protein
MGQPETSNGECRSFRIELLDPSSGRPLNQWKFENCTEVRIGRSSEQHIEICDPYVSRHHASLVFRDGTWMLFSHGRNGVIVASQQVTEYPLEDGMQFRLGVEGPTLRFAVVDTSYSIAATVNFNADEMGFLQFNEKQVEQEVEEVTDGEYFKKIQCLANKMRGKPHD